MDRGYERCRVDGRPKGKGILQKEKIADIGEVRLPGMDHALECGEVDVGGGFEDGSDNPSRIPRSFASTRLHLVAAHLVVI